LVRPNDRCIEERADVVDFDLERLEYVLPDAALRPASEAVVDGLPRPEARVKIAPRRAGAHAPDDCVDEFAIAALGDRARSGRKKRLELLPLCVGEFVAVHGKR
jgi:hypothetical protein